MLKVQVYASILLFFLLISDDLWRVERWLDLGFLWGEYQWLTLMKSRRLVQGNLWFLRLSDIFLILFTFEFIDYVHCYKSQLILNSCQLMSTRSPHRSVRIQLLRLAHSPNNMFSIPISMRPKTYLLTMWCDSRSVSISSTSTKVDKYPWKNFQPPSKLWDLKNRQEKYCR